MFKTILLNKLPTLAPNITKTRSTMMATKMINSAYSTSPWPFEEEKSMNALNNRIKPNNKASIDNPSARAIALGSQGESRR